MAIWKEMRCDHNGPKCYSMWNNGPIGFGTDSRIRAEAKKRGWVKSGIRDFCPACKLLAMEG